MEFEWDEAKRGRNLLKHQLDFIDVRAIFDGRPVLTVRSVYPNEERYLTTGLLNDLVIAVVWTQRNSAIRIISARRASHAERRAYRAAHGE
jgi:uncharacterized DUF497 family protein